MAEHAQEPKKVPDPKTLFGQRLREVRQARGHSQEELADLAGIDRTYVSSCERGRRNVCLINIWRLANALEVEPSALLQQPGGVGMF
jgi:transcriptional regulator with XRE-family HTH domain